MDVQTSEHKSCNISETGQDTAKVIADMLSLLS